MKSHYLKTFLLILFFCFTQILSAQEKTPETEPESPAVETTVKEQTVPEETVTTETEKTAEKSAEAEVEETPAETAENEKAVSPDSTTEPVEQEMAEADTSDSLTETAVSEDDTLNDTVTTQTVAVQDTFTVSGTITDAETGDSLTSITVSVVGTADSTTTNTSGYYSLTLSQGTHTIRYFLSGYKTVTKEITVTENISLDMSLKSAIQTLSKQVVVAEAKNHNITSTEMSVEKFDIEEIETVPMIMGEKDIMKTIQLTPGITVITEGEIGFVVRGSGIDENLVLMDDMPLYYSSHQQGLFSVFNSDFIESFKVYKGGIPASYGGRASSILDVKMKGDNVDAIHTKLSLGLITSKFMLETPIVKDKLTIAGAGRFTKLSVGNIHDQIKGGNEIAGKGTPKRQDDKDKDTTDTKDPKEEFYFFDPSENWLDLNGKMVYNINENNCVDVVGYLGRDSAITAGGLTEWGNRAAALHWRHDFNQNFLSNTSFTYSRYYTSARGGIYKFYSGIKIGNFDQEFALFPNKNNEIRFGLFTEYQKYNHGALEDTEENFGKFMPPMQAIESALYVGNDQKIGEKLAVYYGLRYSFYFQMGPGYSHDYDEESNESVSSEYFPAKSDIMHVYHNPEPRLSLNYIVNEQNSLKFFYNRSAQYSRLMALGMQLQWYDIWLPCTKNVPPLKVDQLALGYFGNFLDDNLQFSVETYYKWYHNTHAFEDGLHNYLIDNLEAYVATGKGRSYGLELMLKKPYGRLCGWLSYNLGKSEKQIDVINKGRWFSSMFDKTHDVTAVLSFELFKNLSISATFVYMTGNAVTLPEGYYFLSDVPFPYWEGRNKYRLPAYHRLDLGLKYELAMLKRLFNKYNRDVKISLELSGYNIYNRRNIVSMGYSDNNKGSGKITTSTGENVSLFEPYGISIYGFIPSFLLNVEF